MERNGSELSSSLWLDCVGKVAVFLDADGLSWKSFDSESILSSCLCAKKLSQTETWFKFCDIYAVEYDAWGLISDVEKNSGGFLSYRKTEMYRFVVHGFKRGTKCGSSWVLADYIFGHKDMEICQAWVDYLNSLTSNKTSRPKNLLVFVHPLCGKGYGLQNWQKVAPVFSRARVQTKVIVTQRARHAFDTVASLSDKELTAFDGIVAVGGDGIFNEILNGLLSSRHSAPYPPAPTDFSHAGNSEQPLKRKRSSDLNQHSVDTCSEPCRTSSSDVNGMSSMPSNEDEPLLSTSDPNGSDISKLMKGRGPSDTDEDKKIHFPNEWFRLGLIPAGSTDAIVLSTTGVRDPITSALHIILGSNIAMDIAQVVGWKVSPSSLDVPSVRYAASFAGYGFYGEVIKESEKCRWMGPKRYDYAGTMAFLKHRSYEAEIIYLDAEKPDSSHGQSKVEGDPLPPFQKKPDKVICRANCSICNEATKPSQCSADTAISVNHEESRWLKSKGRFLSVGAAVISCRNERAPDGLVANAHLADGYLHLILVKDCSRPFYLWHLTKVAKTGSDPFDFSFIEYHKTSAFTFASSHDEGLWNVDGEMLQACQVSVQVFRGLINMFASGPEV